MTICHSNEEIHQTQYINSLKENDILIDTCITLFGSSITSEFIIISDILLPISLFITYRNQYVRESDQNTQIRQH